MRFLGMFDHKILAEIKKNAIKLQERSSKFIRTNLSSGTILVIRNLLEILFSSLCKN